MQTEGVKAIEPVAPGGRSPEHSRTLLCFVLVAGSQHAFCSSYDFGPWPLLAFVQGLPEGVQQVGRSDCAFEYGLASTVT